MDLSKAYECLPHDLLIAKREAYGLDKPSLNLVNDYLHFWKQRKQFGSSDSDLTDFTRGIPQISILGPLLFNVFINISLFIEKSDICKFTDDNTLFSCGDNLSVILESIEHDMKILLRWFKKHIENLCWNANYKLHALRCMRKFLAVEKAKLLGNTLIDNQFSSAPLIWMFCHKTLYLNIEKIYTL